MMPKPILSICIPTFNRADVLKHCLDAIVNHELAKTGNIEIVICDNASTDETESLMQEYKGYGFVKYIRNEENIGVIYNTIKVLDCANGGFRKLLNDYSVFTSDGLQYMYEEVVANQKERPVLLFDNKDNIVPIEAVCYNIDEVVHQVGYWLTWMGVYGYWEEDWRNIQDKLKYYEKTFTTLDWLIQMLEQKHVIKVYRGNYTQGRSYQRKQGGYNFFKVFVQDYLDLWQIFKSECTIAPSLYLWIKKDIWPFTWSYTKNLLIRKDAGNFGTMDGWRILFKYYGNEWYFWWSLAKYPLGLIKRKIKKRLRN